MLNPNYALEVISKFWLRRRRTTWITPYKPTGAVRGRNDAPLSELRRSSTHYGVEEGGGFYNPELRLSACKGLSTLNSYGV